VIEEPVGRLHLGPAAAGRRDAPPGLTRQAVQQQGVALGEALIAQVTADRLRTDPVTHEPALLTGSL